MTKEEAYEVWQSITSQTMFSALWKKERDAQYFEHWWNERVEKLARDTQTTTTGDGIPYEYISSTSTAPDSFFGRVASGGGAKDTKS
ncbi:MAG TPA: hypothetical protein PLJ74_05295 [Myxococcota bacterium]|nr:hypothetical protein [Myxococcota bacterium]